jgi:hypothetical protein
MRHTPQRRAFVGCESKDGEVCPRIHGLLCLNTSIDELIVKVNVKQALLLPHLKQG